MGLSLFRESDLDFRFAPPLGAWALSPQLPRAWAGILLTSPRASIVLAVIAVHQGLEFLDGLR